MPDADELDVGTLASIGAAYLKGRGKGGPGSNGGTDEKEANAVSEDEGEKQKKCGTSVYTHPHWSEMTPLAIRTFFFKIMQ